MECLDEKVIDIISKIGEVEKSLLNKHTNLNITGLNSILIIQVLIKIEQIFSIEIEDEDLDFSLYNTIEDVIRVVEKQMQKTHLTS